MPILQPKRTAADDFLDAPDTAPAPAASAASPGGPTAADAFLDAPDQAPEKQGPVRRFLGNLAEQFNPVTAVKGIAQLTAHPIETYKSDATARSGILEDAKRRFSGGDVPGGIVKGAEAFIPFLGPALSQAGDKFESGDIAGGAGQSVGMGLNLAGPAALKGAGIRVPQGIRSSISSTAERLYQSALKPSTRIAPEATASMVQTGLREGIPVGKAGLEKLTGLVDDLNSRISSEIQAAGPERRISPGRAVQNTIDLEQKFTQQVNPKADLAAIKSAREEFLGQLQETSPEARTTIRYAEPAPREAPSTTELDYLGRPTSIEPTRTEISSLKSVAQERGYAAPEDVPSVLEKKISARRNLESLAESVSQMEGQVGRYRNELGEWMGVKSVLPESLQKGFAYRDIADIINKGLRGEKLVGKRASFFNDLKNYALRKDGPISEAELHDFLYQHGLRDLASQSEVEMAAERQAIQGGGAAEPTFDVAALESAPKTPEPIRPTTPQEPPVQPEAPAAAPELGRRVGPSSRFMTAAEAQAMKQGTYRQLKSRSYGELKSATVEAQKALARGLKEELAAQFPEIDTLNAREGMLLKLEPAIEKAVQRFSNHQLIGIGTPIAGGAVGVVTGSRPLAAATGAIKAILDNPVVKSRLAIAINRGSAGRIPLPMAQARVTGYLNALGQGEAAADEQLPASQATQ